MDRLTGNSSAVNFMRGLFWHQPLAPARLEELGEKIGEEKEKKRKKKGGERETENSPSVFGDENYWKLEVGAFSLLRCKQIRVSVFGLA